MKKSFIKVFIILLGFAYLIQPGKINELKQEVNKIMNQPFEDFKMELKNLAKF